MLVDEELVDQAVLDVDAPRAGASEVAHKLLERRRRVERVCRKDGQQFLRLGLQAGVAVPSRTDSRMPGMETR